MKLKIIKNLKIYQVIYKPSFSLNQYIKYIGEYFDIIDKSRKYSYFRKFRLIYCLNDKCITSPAKHSCLSIKMRFIYLI